MKLRDELMQTIQNKIDFEKNQIEYIIKNIGLKTYTTNDIANRKKRIKFYEDCLAEIDELYKSLCRLVQLARYDTGGSRVVAQFLLSMYNPRYSAFYPRDLNLLDNSYWQDVINVLKLDRINFVEIHEYLDDGKNIFHKLIEDLEI